MASRPPQLDSSARQKSLQPAIRKFFAQPWVEITVGLLVIVSVILTLIEFALESNLWRSNGQWEPWVTPYGTFDERHLNGLALMNFSITLIFVVELTFRFMGASSKKRFFKEFWLDIVATLPVFRVFSWFSCASTIEVGSIDSFDGCICSAFQSLPQDF